MGVILIPILFSSGKQYIADSGAVQLVCLALMYRSNEAKMTNKRFWTKYKYLFHRYIHTYRLQHTPPDKNSRHFKKKKYSKKCLEEISMRRNEEIKVCCYKRRVL